MSGNLDSAANAEPNLTPILDMVFQLITFFMLVINFKAGEVDLDLNLPVVGSARPVEAPGLDLLVLNVAHNGRPRLYGSDHEPEAFIRAEAQAVILKHQLNAAEVQAGKVDLPSTVVLRADRGVRFAALNKVLVACRHEGFRQFTLRSTIPQPE